MFQGTVLALELQKWSSRQANGSKGYVWVHTSDEFADGRKIILYSFEKSRSADHLREHISSLVQHLVSDAYSACGTIEGERKGLSVCNCWMCCRRAWARAVYVMEPGLGDIAIDELFSNIVNYAYSPEEGPVTVRMDVADEPHSVIITFIDHGKPYNPLTTAAPDMTLAAKQRHIGGLGVFMVKNTMDDVAYEYRDGMNILTIRKKV